MNKHLKILLNGVMLIAPLAATIYIIAWITFKLDSAVIWGIGAILGPARAEQFELPFPGLGALGTVIILYGIGRLGQIWLFEAMLNAGERFVSRIPLIKTLYSSVRDMLKFVIGDQKQGTGRAVVFRAPGSDIKLMGIVTGENPPPQLADKCGGRVCVYFPMSYQIGGYTAMVPPEQLETVEVDGMVMMRLAMTGGVGSKHPEEKKIEPVMNEDDE